ncbi:MAG: YegS/Rv2252/BmrU family lipid kinase [Cyclobacteriaceae bacterium]|nr:YegS/Rv2252/BmrU family lipid kinase [Cyclobacteriaceae bacterium]
MKKFLFIINKYSGRGYQPRVEGKILDACARNNTECTLEFTQKPGHARELARSGTDHFDTIVAVGGDGTVNEVASGLVNTSVPLGIIPKGSGNGLARHLGIPMKYDRAVNTLFESKPLLIDTFELNGRLGVNVAGIGFDGHVANLFGDRSVRGLWGYTRLVVREFLHYRETEVTVQTDKHEYTSCDFMLAIANSSQYGNNARIAPHASLTDQLLHIVHVAKPPAFYVPLFIEKLFTGSLRENKFYKSEVCQKACISLTRETPFHIDGEPCGRAASFNICIKPATLSVLAPLRNKAKI